MKSKREQILHWSNQGLIDREKIFNVLSDFQITPDNSSWKKLIEQLLIWFGGLALIFAMMFFIAFNWDEMGRFAKFALVECAIIVCLIAYWKLNFNKTASQTGLMLASISLGILMALYGQTYQTGADPWQLFAYWALLISPWVIVARFSAILILWVFLINISMLLYYQLMGRFFIFTLGSKDSLFWMAFLFNALVWLTWELASKKMAWLNKRWAVRLLATATGVPATLLLIGSITDNIHYNKLAILSYIILTTTIYLVYRKKINDLFMLAGMCLSLITVLTVFFTHALFNNSSGIASFFIMTLLVVGMASSAAIWLKNIYREQQS